ncbi:alpha/beta fold hydrolase [Streptomyces sp. TS71-3]|uniref:alpha/beta fold hydrolase n=1 Tax=Streptomyces sp. TS71-3 TaxID=2733862 RepID=UPI001BB30B04|nr:alpha/beta hydrolase [Streptomyces sp. TS71-3]
MTAVSADGTSLHVESHGPADAPAVVLVHGWACNTAFWAAQVRDLAADHRVITYDLRGHGRSDVPEGSAGYGTRQLGEDLAAVLATALEPGQRAVLAGHSMGGMTLMAAAGAEEVREHAAAVLLVSTGGSRLLAESLLLPMRPGRMRSRGTGMVLNSRAPLGPVTPLSKRILKYGTMGRAATPEMVEAAARVVHACPRGPRHHWSKVLGWLDLDAEARRLTAPTAILVGTADRLTPPVHSRRLAEALPRCVEATELPGLGHMVPLEAPDEVNGRIRELARRYVPAEGGAKGVASA